MPFDGTNLTELAAHLLRAKRYIEENGWCQGEMEWPDGRVCFLGALEKAEPGGYNTLRLGALVARAIGLGLGDTLHGWNDASGRTLADVLAGFDAAIALVVAEEAAA